MNDDFLFIGGPWAGEYHPLPVKYHGGPPPTDINVYVPVDTVSFKPSNNLDLWKFPDVHRYQRHKIVVNKPWGPEETEYVFAATADEVDAHCRLINERWGI